MIKKNRVSFPSSLLFCAISLSIAFPTPSYSSQKKTEEGKKRLIYSDNFSAATVSKNWVIENSPDDKKPVYAENGQLHLNVKKGLTVWLNKNLQGDILIEYDRAVLMTGGSNDRMGDCNQFWMATSPNNKLFGRDGTFKSYDDLNLYYVGVGAHNNTVTRMRRYNGTEDREVLGDLKDTAFLLRPNKKMHIQIWVQNGVNTFVVDGKTYFTYKDKKPYTKGLFAFRSLESHQVIDNFKIWQLK